MTELNGSALLVQLVNFIAIYWVLRRFAWVPILALLSNREATVRQDYEKAEAARREMEGLVREYQEKVRNAEAEAQARINARLERAETQAAQIVTKAEEDARALGERSRAEIERERQKVLAELRGQVTHLSVAIAGKIIDEQLDETKHHALVDDFIGRLGAVA